MIVVPAEEHASSLDARRREIKGRAVEVDIERQMLEDEVEKCGRLENPSSYTERTGDS